MVRPNIRAMKAYSSARDEFKGEASVFLDANENPLNGPYNRYPDPLQWKLKQRVAELKGTKAENIFFGNGSDEPIDLVMRIFCEPGVDNVVAIDPTYGMYQVCADVNNVEYRKVRLNDDFSLDAGRLLEAVDGQTKLIFICSPNNPTANLMARGEVERVLRDFAGIVVLDEAYIDFSADGSWLPDLDKYPNLIVLQTFSKAWGLAAVRLGMAFASADIVRLFNKVKYPYNVNQLTQEFVSKELDLASRKEQWVESLLAGRNYLRDELQKLPEVLRVYPSDANFVLARVTDANGLYARLADAGVIVRNRNSVTLCEGCLRITVGTADENRTLIETWKNLTK